jgi:hypothetical protein
VRGLAGIQALATADVLADIHPKHWNDHVRDLVNARVGFCGIFEHFSGFEYFLLLNIVHDKRSTGNASR